MRLFSLISLNHFYFSLLVLIIRKSNGSPLVPSLENCPNLENISQEITWKRVEADPPMAAKLLRLQFHDCFVRGCEASILLNSTTAFTAEKDAPVNAAVMGYDIIDEIKERVENECPNSVSCADIIALAARDATSYQFRKPMWPVYFGRKDGKVSSADEATRDVPDSKSNFTILMQQFQKNGLDVLDFVALSGSHTIGISHCKVFAPFRLNFTGKGDTDPAIDPEYADYLRKQCGDLESLNEVDMDPGSGLTFDNHYFAAINQRKLLFQSDIALLEDPTAATYVTTFQNNPDQFMKQFALSMVKMGEIGVITDQTGEIRKNCRFVNEYRSLMFSQLLKNA